MEKMLKCRGTKKLDNPEQSRLLFAGPSTDRWSRLFQVFQQTQTHSLSRLSFNWPVVPQLYQAKPVAKKPVSTVVAVLLQAVY